MMSHSLCHFLLLVFLFVRGVVLVKGSNKAISCGNDTNCQALVKLMAAVNEINNKLEEPSSCPDVHVKLDKQAKHVEELNVKLDRCLASTGDIVTLLEKHSADLLSIDERLKTNDVCPDANEKLEKLATNVRDMHSKQVKDAEELKVNMNRSLSSTAAISTQLEKHSADLLRHDERLKAHDVSQNNIYELVKSSQSPQLKPRDCSDIRDRGNRVSGVYRVDLGSDNRKIEVDVYCDFKNMGESWLVFQRRKDGSVNFDRNWIDYANGFGDLTGEFWLGNDKLSLLTTNKKYKLRIELEDFLGEKRWAEYATFSVKPSTDKYRLIVGGYSGNAGDSFTNDNNMMFSTKDADNDSYNLQCTQYFSGAFWFNVCGYSSLNGLYLKSPNNLSQKGIIWYHWKGLNYSLKATEMKITAVK